MKTATKSTVTHRTAVTSETKTTDGGRALLMELFDDLRTDKRVGKLTAQFGVGGSIASLVFEENETIRQSEIGVEPSTPEKRYL